MRTILYYKSMSGSTKFNNVIYCEDVSIKSQSSLILLNDYLRERDEDFLRLEYELQEYLNKRYLFLIREKRKTGDLICHYCNRVHLQAGYRYANMAHLNNINPDLATIDHVIPVSSGIDVLDESNWVVSCKKCNGKKGSMKYEDFKLSLKNKKIEQNENFI